MSTLKLNKASTRKAGAALNNSLLVAVLGFFVQVSVGLGQPASKPGVEKTAASKQGEFKSLQKGRAVLSLLPDGGLWVDLSRKWVVADGQVCLREGPLEMFACPNATKEHESIVSTKSTARFVHAALLAIGARTGNPVKFDPEYIPASGSVIDVICLWKDEEGQIEAVLAQNWVAKGRSRKTLGHAWVFAGSGFWTDSATGEKRYYADDGALLCVSNFPTATLDIAVESSKDNNFLEYHANTSAIPELQTPVRLVLVNRPGKSTTNVPRALNENAEILKQVKQWAEAIEAGQKPPKPTSPVDNPDTTPTSQTREPDDK